MIIQLSRKPLRLRSEPMTDPRPFPWRSIALARRPGDRRGRLHGGAWLSKPTDLAAAMKRGIRGVGYGRTSKVIVPGDR